METETPLNHINPPAAKPLLSVRASSISINMEDKKPNVIIVGSGHEAGLLAIKIAELKLANPNCEVVTLEEAKERGLTQTFEITAPKPLPELQQVTLKDNFFSDGKSARNKRREAERKAKKGKRRW